MIFKDLHRLLDFWWHGRPIFTTRHATFPITIMARATAVGIYHDPPKTSDPKAADTAAPDVGAGNAGNYCIVPTWD